MPDIVNESPAKDRIQLIDFVEQERVAQGDHLTGLFGRLDSRNLSDGEHITLLVDDGTAYTITWPTMKWVNNGGVAPTLATTGYTHIYLYKVGSVLYGSLLGETS